MPRARAGRPTPLGNGVGRTNQTGRAGDIAGRNVANPKVSAVMSTNGYASSGRSFAGMGAKVILHAVNGGRSRSPLSAIHWQYHESNLLLRAHASGLWIVKLGDPRHKGSTTAPGQ